MDPTVTRLVAPFVEALLVAAVGAWTCRARRVTADGALAAVIAGAVAVGAVAVGVHLPPREITDAVPLLAGIAAVGAVGRAPAVARWIVAFAVMFLVFGFVLWTPFAIGALPAPVAVLPVLAGGATLALGPALRGDLPERCRPLVVYLGLLAAAVAGVLTDTGSARIGVFASTFAGALFGVAVAGNVPPRVAYTVAVPGLSLLLVGGWAFSATPAPVAAWFALAPIAAVGCTAWWRAAVATVAVLGLGLALTVVLGG